MKNTWTHVNTIQLIPSCWFWNDTGWPLLPELKAMTSSQGTIPRAPGPASCRSRQGIALAMCSFFVGASQFMALGNVWIMSCANASLGMLGMLGQVWYHDLQSKGRPITWRPGIWKMSKGGNTRKRMKTPSIITNVSHQSWITIAIYGHKMATRLRQGCEDRHGDHAEETTPEDDGLTLEDWRYCRCRGRNLILMMMMMMMMIFWNRFMKVAYMICNLIKRFTSATQFLSISSCHVWQTWGWASHGSLCTNSGIKPAADNVHTANSPPQSI